MRYAMLRDVESGTARRTAGATGAPGLRFGDCVFVVGTDDTVARVEQGAERSGSVAKDKRLYLVRQKGRLFQHQFPDIEVVHNAGRFLVVAVTSAEIDAAKQHASHCFEIDSLPESGVVFTRRPHAASASRVAEWIHTLVERVSGTEFTATLQRLTDFPTRHSRSPGYALAADLCVDALTTLGFETALEEVPFGGETTVNVIADKSGAGTDRKLVMAMAHLDSINIQGGAASAAPGADDNGSGSAGVLEIARVLSEQTSVNDLRLVLYGAEELGLFGSKHHVGAMQDRDRARLVAALNMDMIGGKNMSSPTVLIEAGSQPVIDEISDAADMFTSLVVETSLHPFASDHVPFIQAGLPAALTIEGADSDNGTIHTTGDTLDRVDAELAKEILRMNVGYIAQKLENANA